MRVSLHYGVLQRECRSRMRPTASQPVSLTAAITITIHVFTKRKTRKKAEEERRREIR